MHHLTGANFKQATVLGTQAQRAVSRDGFRAAIYNSTD
jgi:hypothetical protein